MTKEEKPAFWRQHLEDFATSGLSVKAYCARAGISVANWYYWRKRLTRDSLPQGRISDNEEFLPVHLAAGPSSLPVVEIQLLSGRSLKLSAPLDSVSLQTLVQVLEGRCG